MNTQELLVHKRGEWQTVEGLHARVVHALSVLDFALLQKDKQIRKNCKQTADAQNYFFRETNFTNFFFVKLNSRKNNAFF